MSSSIAIPTRRKKAPAVTQLSDSNSDSFPSSSSSSYGYGTPKSVASSSTAGTPRDGYQHQHQHYRRPSLLSSSISKSEHTVINIGGPDAPKLITCVKASQGYEWNTELFLPSYADRGHSSELERKQDPVVDIFLTDEEAAAMLPS
ncbi:hypothetical protein LTS18_011024 [Coniosporium uncinatum]|uniref:Uncharacterized protein n=2 Tax=Coniosporium uncinatum TaxID=93489 RepID=A0ACC3D1V0_9PEZI|nr:hypothetical protein LTS18_008211 [Coniosporium uncinatum]KAK3077175.1 hypothetical protein LTS18_011024 [Coniosporium uncinatum]